ncbi:AAA family ATPase (plasmid) [Acinetobacter sp. ESL0695]|uniref:nucleotide-binding protein n=1 Tax=Acinetobacter sp. ESL0695 TaxID=2983215 RepID=UPI0023F39156|nr:AAA family ATPase [Acinetobacter sp. ESL0695]WEV50231.1 AAA family ATPase [Acinetobacter sp. ESL0695]
MAIINIVLQGKGGVGKTFTSLMLAQYLKDKAIKFDAIDTDPVNNSFSSFSSLKVKTLNILEKNIIKPKAFDELMEILIETEKDIVVDNGASSFIPIVNYLIENECFEILKDCGHQINIHSIISGGQALSDTMINLHQLLEQFPPYVKFIVWLNEKDGDIAHPDSPGKGFESSKVYRDNKDRISSIIHLKRPSNDTLLDIRKALDLRITFLEAITSDNFSLMEKQRIKIFQRKIYEQLNNSIVYDMPIEEE